MYVVKLLMVRNLVKKITLISCTKWTERELITFSDLISLISLLSTEKNSNNNENRSWLRNPFKAK